jgi:hypothetical protein
MLAAWPTAGTPHTLFQLLLGPANTAFSRLLLLGILDPTDELVAGQRRDVLPRIQCSVVSNQRLTEIARELVHHPTRNSLPAHRATAVQAPGGLNPVTVRTGPIVALPAGRWRQDPKDALE